MIDITKARRAGVPLLAVETNDATQSQLSILRKLNGKADVLPLLHHDLSGGLTALNQPGRELIASVYGDVDLMTMPPAEVLMQLGGESSVRALGAAAQAMIFFTNPQLYWNAPDAGAGVVQAIWNLRDVFKVSGSTLILFVTPGTFLPEVLKNDVFMLRDTLPDRAEIETIVASILNSTRLTEAQIGDREKIYDMLTGLPPFAVEQILAMSISKAGVNLKDLWARKRQMIEQTPGLTVWEGGETFADVGGYENVKTFLRKIMGGLNPPKAIVFEDEIDKAYAGLAGDNTGTTQDQLGVQLKFMQDRNARGIIFFGVRGSGKTAIGKAVGNELGVPTIEIDRGAMKTSLLGASEQRVRAVLDVIDAISNGSALFVATCNKMAILPTELVRRFNYGVYFFDLPDRAARAKIWDIYLKKYSELTGMDRPNDEGWSGSDIKNCTLLAHELKTTLLDAANNVVPIGVSSANQIDTMRREANRNYIDAAQPGIFEYPATVKPVNIGSGTRRVELGGD